MCNTSFFEKLSLCTVCAMGCQNVVPKEGLVLLLGRKRVHITDDTDTEAHSLVLLDLSIILGLVAMVAKLTRTQERESTWEGGQEKAINFLGQKN